MKMELSNIIPDITVGRAANAVTPTIDCWIIKEDA